MMEFDGQDNIQLLEITKLDPNLVTAEITDYLKYIDATIDLAKGCLLIGSLVFPASAPILAGLAGVGSVIQIIISLPSIDRNKEVMDRIQSLESLVHELEEKMNNKFDELKLFITETEFSVDVLNETAVLLKLLRNCMKCENGKATEMFKYAYENNSPLNLAYTIISYLEQNSTNPLLMAMETETIKTKTTFNKWKGIIKNVIGELLFIEGIASGLLKNSNSYDWYRMKERENELNVQMNNLREKMTKINAASYWKAMESTVKASVKDRSHFSISQHADALKTDIDDYLTNDAFYIVVSLAIDQYTSVKKFASSEQFLEFHPDETKIKVFIYRSLFAYSATPEEMETLKKAVQDYESGLHITDPEMPGRMMNHRIPNSGFNMIIGESKEEIRAANCSKWDNGPGWVTKTWNYNGPVEQKYIVGYI